MPAELARRLCGNTETTQWDWDIYANVADMSGEAAWNNGQNLTSLHPHDGYAFTAPVGQFTANAFGLYDMHGNVSEFCTDVYVSEAYSERSSTTTNPIVDSPFGNHLFRGGSWRFIPSALRSADRGEDANLAGLRRLSNCADNHIGGLTHVRRRCRHLDRRLPRLIAPFESNQAKSAQQQWADHLGTEVVVENSIGMQLAHSSRRGSSIWDRRRASGTNRSGSGRRSISRTSLDEPQHRVRLDAALRRGSP